MKDLDLTPRQVVAELDRYIVGQDNAKRAVAVAIRSRWRRQHLAPELRDEVAPKNIIMIGPTGVGKTEIARRLANLVNAPFLKVEATKYTEVGYVGRDVEGMIRDLIELAVNMVRAEQAEKVASRAENVADDRLLDLLLPATDWSPPGVNDPADEARRKRTRENLRTQLQSGALEDKQIELDVEEKAVPAAMFASAGLDSMGPEFQNLFEKILPTRTQSRPVSVSTARRILLNQETDKLIDQDKIVAEALARVEDRGIIFLDEIDKVVAMPGEHGTSDVSRFGMQRDILPIVEGCTVTTRHGMVRTDHVLFIAAGAFTNSSPSDLIPELQGRFPIRVALDDLGREEFVRILTEPANALIIQQIALLATEGIHLEFTDGAIAEMALLSERANILLQNIGARRLYTIMEKVLEEIQFNASDALNKKVVIDSDYVRIRVADILLDEEESRTVL